MATRRKGLPRMTMKMTLRSVGQFYLKVTWVKVKVIISGQGYYTFFVLQDYEDDFEDDNDDASEDDDEGRDDDDDDDDSSQPSRKSVSIVTI